MAEDNREYKKADSDPQRQQTPDTGQGNYGDHPFLGGDRQPFKKELLHFPERSTVDPMTRLPSDPAREESRKTYEMPHDPSIDYQPPNPKLIVPPPNLTMDLLGIITALLLFAIVAGLLFYKWMSPLPRYPGETKQSPGLVHKVP